MIAFDAHILAFLPLGSVTVRRPTRSSRPLAGTRWLRASVGVGRAVPVAVFYRPGRDIDTRMEAELS